VIGAAPPIGGMVRTIVIVVVMLLVGWLLLAWAVLKRPILAIPVAMFTALVLLVGMHDAQALAIYAVVGLWIWRRAHRDSFDRVVGRWMRGRWRRWWVYERRWRATMLHCGLGRRGALRDAAPKIDRVRSNRWCDRVRVRLLLGQCTDDYEQAAPGLAHSFGAIACRVKEDRPGRLWLQFTSADPLIETVPALPVSEDVDLEAVPIGRQEDGEPWRVRLLGTHVLVAGATGAGKGSVLCHCSGDWVRRFVTVGWRCGRSTPRAAWSCAPVSRCTPASRCRPWTTHRMSRSPSCSRTPSR
jgi:S-DNA-T family DNA segregation ATPase FtsK/SpoIIIE